MDSNDVHRHKIHKKLNQNSKHTPKQGANSLQKLHVQGHNYMPKSGFKIIPKGHKNLTKSKQKQEYILHIFEVKFLHVILFKR